MPEYTKARETIQYTEIVYYRDGEEFARERLYDDSAYDISAEEPMTEEDINDWADEERLDAQP